MRDGEVQQRLKQVVISALATMDTGQVSSIAAQATKEMLDEPMNYEQLMFGIPARVIAELCGFTAADAHAAVVLIGDFVQCIPATASAEQQHVAAVAAEQLLSQFSAEIQRTKNGSLLAALLKVATQHDWHEQAPLIANAIGFLSQSYDATAGLIGNTLLAIQREGEVPVERHSAQRLHS
jgi:cytochrome P450